MRMPKEHQHQQQQQQYQPPPPPILTSTASLPISRSRTFVNQLRQSISGNTPIANSSSYDSRVSLNRSMSHNQPTLGRF